MNQTESGLHGLFDRPLQKIVISRPRQKPAACKRVVLERKQNGYLAAQYTQKQVFHQTVEHTQLEAFCLKLLQEQFSQLNAWDDSREYTLLASKKGKLTLRSVEQPCAQLHRAEAAHNRTKNYIIPEHTIVPPLVDMGIFTQEGKVVRTMYDKFKQINRFIEMVDDAVKKQRFARLNIIDFGCGKSYLTFILYYYFTEIAKIPVQMVGLDLKADVIQKCNEAARRYGYDGLRFELGDINGYQCDFDVDMVISLHACDTATDYALFNAVAWGAKLIFSVPCCQHELNGQISGEALPLLTRYGIVQERFAALATDAIRGGLLEACGYKTQLLEFVDLAHTPKNILIRAVRKSGSAAAKSKALAEVRGLMETFGLHPALYRLLSENAEQTGLRL